MKLYRFLTALALIGLISLTSSVNGEPFEGYTLFNPTNARTTYLIDMDNETVHRWNNGRAGGYSVYLLENGNILRPAQVNNPRLRGGGFAGLIQEIDWDGDIVWEFEYSSATYITHHDLEPMPNGNILLIAWEVKTAAEARQAGYNRNAPLWPDHIIEVEPEGDDGGDIVWEWHAWDHLIQDYDRLRDNYGVIADHPELLDINMAGRDRPGPGGGDWLHINGISYNQELDQIVISSHHADEIFVIDHSTTTEEAASHDGGSSGMGGDILYRWGNPSNYDAEGDQYFDVVHCSWWVPNGLPGAGNILVFNNGERDHQSVVVEIEPPYDEDGNYELEQGQAFGPEEPVWTYTDRNFYSNHLGGCQRLPNGNTLISESTSGHLFEVEPDGDVVWDYDNRNQIARSLRYATNYPGLYALNPVDDDILVINEFLADNDTTEADQDDEYDDWIELYNNGDDELSLWGFYLSDDREEPVKWVFPDTSIEAQDYLIIWADDDVEQNGLHANFELSAEGGEILFLAPDQTVLDEVEFGEQTTDRSIGRYPNGTGDFREMTPSYASENLEGVQDATCINHGLPDRFSLLQNYPNPFNPSTSIGFQLAYRSYVTLTIYNILGEKVVTLVDKPLSPGYYKVVWNVSIEPGNNVSAGIYFYCLQVCEYVETLKLVLIR